MVATETITSQRTRCDVFPKSDVHFQEPRRETDKLHVVLPGTGSHKVSYVMESGFHICKASSIPHYALHLTVGSMMLAMAFAKA